MEPDRLLFILETREHLIWVRGTKHAARRAETDKLSADEGIEMLRAASGHSKNRAPNQVPWTPELGGDSTN